MAQHWVIWDGDCGLCSHFAQRVRDRDPQRQFQIVQYQSCPSPPMNPAMYERCKSEMAVVTDSGRELFGARAVLYVVERQGFGWVAKVLAAPPLIWIMSLGYALIARNRGMISKRFFSGTACGLNNRYPEID